MRLNEPVELLAEREAERLGMQKAVFMRWLVEEYLAELGHEFPRANGAPTIREVRREERTA
ncbi:MAG TPA: hypothetical protein VIZ86_16540 [Pseudomonas sp.]